MDGFLDLLKASDEATRLKALDWSVPAETRISIVGSKSLIAVDDEHPFERVFDVSKNAYAEAAPYNGNPANPVMIRNQCLGSDTDGTDWIALNPGIAMKLGWTLAPDGLFKWVDDCDEVMVETVWWKDGCIDLGPYEADAEVGEGFIVLAAPVAAEKIYGLIPEPTRFLLLQRSCVSEQSVIEAQAVKFSEPVARY